MFKGSLIDISPEHTLKGFRLKSPFHDESALPIQGSTGTQLSQQEQLHMFRLPVHGLAKLHVIGEYCLFGALTSHLQCSTS